MKIEDRTKIEIIQIIRQKARIQQKIFILYDCLLLHKKQKVTDK